MNVVSEKFIQGATLLLAEEFRRFNSALTLEDSIDLAKYVIPKIDWENEALMHKGLGWIAKNYLYDKAA